MSLTDILAKARGLQSIARDLGLSEDQAAAGAKALLPATLGGIKKQVQVQPAGLEGLGGFESSELIHCLSFSKMRVGRLARRRKINRQLA